MKNRTDLKKYITGVTALTGLTATSQAAIVYWNPADTTLSVLESASFDMLTGVVTASGSRSASAFQVNNSKSNYVYLIATLSLSDPVMGGDKMSRLAGGDTIDGSQFGGSTKTYFDYYNDSGYPWNTGTDGTNGYVGLKFAISGNIHYAWAQFTHNDISNTLTLHDFAYENIPETTILAGAGTGAIPEPSSLLLLASGAVLVARRNRKAA